MKKPGDKRQNWFQTMHQQLAFEASHAVATLTKFWLQIYRFKIAKPTYMLFEWRSFQCFHPKGAKKDWKFPSPPAPLPQSVDRIGLHNVAWHTLRHAGNPKKGWDPSNDCAKMCSQGTSDIYFWKKRGESRECLSAVVVVVVAGGTTKPAVVQ